MPTQLLDNTGLLAPQIEMSSYAATLAGVQDIRSGVVRTDVEWPAEAIVNLHLLGKGVGWALAIESAAALSTYGIWHLWHLWL
ncbi:MAG: hypothetical protein ABR865_13580 [Terracidiphilus sp.]